MEEINQSAAMWARPLPTINIVRRGAGGSTHGRADALVLFSIYCLALGFVCSESSIHTRTPVPHAALESKLSEPLALPSAAGDSGLMYSLWALCH